MSKRPRKPHASIIFDVLYGFIPVTEWEEKIIHTPFFQRLRWIRQLGFANYIFPGAEHTRFAHALGVMHSMHQMIHALGIGVPDSELFSPKSKSPAAILHKSLRIAALLHDIGTFPFSHAIEHAYIRHGKGPKALPNNHEHLGAYIIKNTNYEGGITRILEDYGFDIGMLSRLIKGTSPNPIANQLMHSDLDADRMDYLIRDSHYTGIKYGQFDRDYILANLETYHAGRGQTGFGVRENAVHAVEDFLIARYGWYSQVIKNPASAKFDIISSHLAEAFLERGLLHSFSDLLEMIDGQSEKFYWWNDVYFITRCQEIHSKRTVADPRVSEMNEMLLFRRPPRTLQNDIFSHRILKAEGAQGGEAERKRLEGKIASFVSDAEAAFQKFGTGKEWLVVDVPAKDVVFTSGLRQRGRDSGLLERDPIKVVRRNGSATLLLDYENSLMRMLSNFTNFAPNVYANDAAVMLLKKRHLI